MDISVIIVSWNVRDLLARCLESIFSVTKDISFEVIVVDNHSADGTTDMVRARFPRVRLIANDSNRGFAAANNQGLKIAAGTHIFFLNPDTECTENSLKILFDILERRPDVALVGPQLRYADGTVQPTVKRDPTVCDQAWILSKLFHFIRPACVSRYLAKDFDYTREQEVQQLMGAAIAARGEYIRKMGGWNERYFIWWEDLDLCASVRKAGQTVLYTPATHITHHEGKSFAQQLSFKKQLRFTRGMRTYFRAHRPYKEYITVSILAPVSLLLALGAQLIGIKPRTQSRA